MFSQKESSIISAKNANEVRNILEDKIRRNEVIPHKTLMLFDLDLTLFDRSDIMSDLYPQERKEFLDALAKKDHSLVELAYAQSPYKLIEWEMFVTNRMLNNQGFIVLGFTSRRTGKAKTSSVTTVEEDACLSLKQLGIIFSKIAPTDFGISENSVQLENPNLRPYEVIGKPKIFGDHHGVSTIFTANFPKGLIIEHVLNYLSNLEIEIEDILEVDDNIKYLQNLKLSCEKLNKNFLGIYYTYAHDHKKGLSTDIVEFQKKYLIEHKQLLTEEFAVELKKSQSSLPKETYKRLCGEVRSLFFSTPASNVGKKEAAFKRIHFELQTLASLYSSLFFVQNDLPPDIIPIYSSLIMDYPTELKEMLQLHEDSTLKEAFELMACAMEEKRFQLENYDRYDEIKNRPRMLPIP